MASGMFLIALAYDLRARKAGDTFEDARRAFFVGALRVLGGLSVAVGVLMLVGIVWTWAESVRDLGGVTGAIGMLLFIVLLTVVGVLLLPGCHVPLVQWFRESEEARREIDAKKRRKD